MSGPSTRTPIATALCGGVLRGRVRQFFWDACMADVFISYAEEDGQRVRILAQGIESIGYTVWWDRDIVGGARYRDTILTELNRARAVLVLWSPRSVRSDFVEDEAEHAKQAGKFIPLRTPDLDARDIPLGFRSRQTLLVDDFAGIAKALVPNPPGGASSAPKHRRPIDRSRPQELVDAVIAAVLDMRKGGGNVTAASALVGRYGARIVGAFAEVCHECAERRTPRVIFRWPNNVANPVRRILIDLFADPERTSPKVRKPAVPYELEFNWNKQAWENYVVVAVHRQRERAQASGLRASLEDLVGTPENPTHFRKVIEQLLAATPIGQEQVELQCLVRPGGPSLVVFEAALNGGAALITKQEGWRLVRPKFSVIGIAVD